MDLIPAIDILDGQCVRLSQGEYDSAQVYKENPAEMARQFQDWGVKRLHVVDLDAAHSDWRGNRKVLRKIRRAFKGTLEVGGGIRREEDVEELLDMGIDRLITGTILAKNPDLVQGWVFHFGDVFVGGIDARDGRVKISGWERDSRFTDGELAVKARELGLIELIYTNIAQDGMLQGPDLENTNRICRESELPVVLSGGIGSMEDLAKVKAGGDERISGIIVGRAFYEGKIDIPRALDLLAAEDKA